MTLVFNGAWLNSKIVKKLPLAAYQNYATKLHLMMEYAMMSITTKGVALMVEIVVTINQDGTPDARKIMAIAHARKSAKMVNLVPVLNGVIKMSSHRVLVTRVAAHLVESVWFVGKFAREDV